MAITFVQQKRKQQYLLLAFVGVVLATLGVVWWGFFREEPQVVLPAEPVKPRPIEINFEVLEGVFLKEAEEFPEVPPFIATGDQKLGRENPFAPYQQSPVSSQQSTTTSQEPTANSEP